MFPGTTCAGNQIVYPKYSPKNHMNIRDAFPPVPFTPAEKAERDELVVLLGELTVLEMSLVRATSPHVSIFRLPKGQFAYRGHCIAVASDVKTIAASLPRALGQAGVCLVVDADGGKEKALENEEVRRSFRVRRAKVRRVLELLFKHR